jgi:hypothetical protein
MPLTLTACACCGERPATLQDVNSSTAYCEPCVTKMCAEDSGAVYCAVKFMAHAMGAIRKEVRDPSEVRRLVNRALDEVLDPRFDGHVDVPVFTMAPKFRPLDGAVAA